MRGFAFTSGPDAFVVAPRTPGAQLDSPVGSALRVAALAKSVAAPAAGVPTLRAGLSTADTREFFLPAGLVDGAAGVLLMSKNARGDWTAKMGKSLLPMVLSKTALEQGWMPTLGHSALPESLEKVVPKSKRYWTAKTADEARAQRDALVGEGFFDEALIKLVDGEPRLCVARLFLYEPEPDGDDDLPPLEKALPGLLGERVDGAIAQPLLEPDGDWSDALKSAAADPNMTMLLSTPQPGMTAAVVDALVKAAPQAAWLMEDDDTAETRKQLARLGPVFKVNAAGAESRLFVSSFVPGGGTGLVSWVAKDESEPVEKVIDFQGITVHVDRPKGYVQTGVAKDGTAWERTYTHDYGFIKGAAGGDGEDLDVFLGDDSEATNTFWVTQKNDEGGFDEFKVFMGFATQAAAESVYKAHIPSKYMGTVDVVPVAHVKALLGLEPGVVIAASKRLTSVESRGVRIAKADEERFVLGIVLEPESVDKQQDIYSAEEIRQCAHKWMADYGTIGLMHKGDAINGKVTVLQSFLAPVDMTIGQTVIKAGTWMMGVRVNDDTLWSLVKEGGLTGFSIGGSAVRKPDADATAKHQG